jgi:hypothetical protein
LVFVAKAEITSGICGFTATVHTRMEGRKCLVSVESECDTIQRLGEALSEVNPFQEISFRGDRTPLSQVTSCSANHPVLTADDMPIADFVYSQQAWLRLSGSASCSINVSQCVLHTVDALQSVAPQTHPLVPGIGLLAGQDFDHACEIYLGVHLAPRSAICPLPRSIALTTLPYMP